MSYRINKRTDKEFVVSLKQAEEGVDVMIGDYYIFGIMNNGCIVRYPSVGGAEETGLVNLNEDGAVNVEDE